MQDKAEDDEMDALMLSINDDDEDSQDRFFREISHELP